MSQIEDMDSGWLNLCGLGNSQQARAAKCCVDHREALSFKLKGILMRYLFCLLAVLLLPAAATAQDIKRAPLADYVSFCLALWDGDSNLYAKAAALSLQDVAGENPGLSITVEKSTLRFFKGTQGSGTVGSIYTTMEDGRETSCDINLTSISERSDLDVMTRTLDLDGQIMTLGPTTMGHWKIRKRQPCDIAPRHSRQEQHINDASEV